MRNVRRKTRFGRLAESLTEAYEEVEMASLALEDRNIPATERALSRCEALLINIDEIMNRDDDFSVPHGHVLLNDEMDDGITFVDLSRGGVISNPKGPRSR